MKVFSHNGENYISINGKDYYLLRGYQTSYGRFIFLQVSSKTSLNKEDLPSSDWNLIKTLSGRRRIWTAYAKRYFNYSREADEIKLAFLGASTAGSYFLALRWLAQRYKFSISTDEIFQLALSYAEGKADDYHFHRLVDLGNSDVDMVLFDSGYYFDWEEANKILKGG